MKWTGPRVCEWKMWLWGVWQPDTDLLVREVGQATAFSHPAVPAPSATSTAGVYKSGRKTTGTFAWTDPAAGGKTWFRISCVNLQAYPVWRIQSWFAFTVLTCSSREKTLDPAQYLVYQFFQTIQHYLKPQHIFLLISTAISKRLLCSLCHILTQLYVQAGCQPTFHTFTALTIHSHVLSPTCAATTPSFRLADMVCATKIALRGNRVQIAWETAQASKKQEKDSYQISNILGIWVEAFGTGFAYSY